MKKHINRFTISASIFAGIALAIGLAAEKPHELVDAQPDYTYNEPTTTRAAFNSGDDFSASFNMA